MWMRSSKGRGQGKSQKGFFNNGSKYTTIASDNNGQVKNKHWYMYATIEYQLFKAYLMNQINILVDYLNLKNQIKCIFVYIKLNKTIVDVKKYIKTNTKLQYSPFRIGMYRGELEFVGPPT